jgi:hypothetical protein
VTTPTVYNERVRPYDPVLIETMTAHLDRLADEALAAAAEMDIQRDEASAEWLTARFTRGPLTIQRPMPLK